MPAGMPRFAPNQTPPAHCPTTSRQRRMTTHQDTPSLGHAPHGPLRNSASPGARTVLAAPGIVVRASGDDRADLQLALLMSLALKKVWRRYRLAQHNLDPNLVDEINREKNAQIHEAYIRRYGPRPQEAKWQSNSSPF